MPTIYETARKSPGVAEDRKQYIAGLTLDAPGDVYHAGGVTFQKFRDRPVKNASGEQIRIPLEGGITHALSDAEVEKVKLAVAKRGWRVSGKRADKVDFSDHRYRPMAGDVSLADFAWLELARAEDLERPEKTHATLQEIARREEELRSAQASEDAALADPKDAAHRAKASREKRTPEF